MTNNSNSLFLWKDASLYLGDSFEPKIHRHLAVQCCFALAGKIKVRGNHNEIWQKCTAAVVGSNVPHSITNPEGPIGLLYLEKCSNSYQSILDYHCLNQPCDIKKHPLILQTSMSNLLTEQLSFIGCSDFLENSTNEKISDSANLLKAAILKVFNGFIEQRKSVDDRITQLLEYLNNHASQSFDGVRLSNEIGLSESRMQHLFKQQIGIPIRRYILWMRLRSVIKSTAAGVSLTNAAYSAGFSDSAHFSRTFKSTFGITASTLFTKSDKLKIFFCD